MSPENVKKSAMSVMRAIDDEEFELARENVMYLKKLIDQANEGHFRLKPTEIKRWEEWLSYAEKGISHKGPKKTNYALATMKNFYYMFYTNEDRYMDWEDNPNSIPVENPQELHDLEWRPGDGSKGIEMLIQKMSNPVNRRTLFDLPRKKGILSTDFEKIREEYSSYIEYSRGKPIDYGKQIDYIISVLKEGEKSIKQ